MLKYFRDKVRENPSFESAVQHDCEEKIANIFWADARMIIDYAIFGDVVTFDTTFGTNKEYIPFGIFVGFNHFRETVIFDAALLYDETFDSFKWLFETFLSIHKNKQPKLSSPIKIPPWEMQLMLYLLKHGMDCALFT
jgi:zinc finger SWIM domain-containing protein 3